MIYIRKGRTPDVVKRRAEEIKRAPENKYKEITLPDDSKKLRDLFDQMPKDEIRTALYQEQHGLCAYCMQRINPSSDGMKIEHYKALSREKESALDYQNYFGVCYGGEKDGDEKPRILCCDAARKDEKLTIKPWDKRQMEAIAYERNGKIYVRGDSGLDSALVQDMQNDIDNVLVLNGIRDSQDKLLADTSSKLIANRRSVYDSVSSSLNKWDKKNLLTVDFLQDKIKKLERMLENNNIAEPYIGVSLYWLKRKLKKLQKRAK